MRSMTWLKLGLLVSLCSCLPPRPKVDFCIIDKQPLQSALTQFSSAATAEDKLHAFLSIQDAPLCHCSNGEKKKYDLTLDKCDAFISVTQKDAQELIAYVVELEKTILELQKKN